MRQPLAKKNMRENCEVGGTPIDNEKNAAIMGARGDLWRNVGNLKCSGGKTKTRWTRRGA